MMTLLNTTQMTKPSREKRLVNAFKRPVNKLYAMFLQSAIPIFDSFNTFLPAEESLIYSLYRSTLRFYRSLFSRFILFEVILEPDDVLRIDLEELDVLKDFNSIFIGAMAKQYARDSDIIGTSEYN